MRHIRSAYEETETALEYGIRKTPDFWYYKFDEYVLVIYWTAVKGNTSRNASAVKNY
ncbi:hypothetical protein [Desulfosporosinus nitroreducens]|uniref:hypothetical protein n=1 Tax=Desulfosporosinus nitroreducens TaxID=2018668 RepID=UPI00207D5263|nr:hypothetical protein [Desulfosporosinus nitroreducens]MCO1603878.1 hypothetical protein [Desulfosporosinus nitroreducens]